MKIHCIMLTKNEADIVQYCLKDALGWADYIYVYDAMSTDGTWEKVKALTDNKLIAWKQHNKPFSEGLRADVFNEFRHLADEGDWWLRLDADEFYHYNPLNRLSKIRERCALIWGVEIKYLLTDADLKNLDFDEPVEQLLPRLRYYRINHSEPRWFRYRKGLLWQPEWAWPSHAGLVLKERFPYKHYQYRSPAQIQNRLNIRRAARASGFSGWAHAAQEDWSQKIVDHSLLSVDSGTDVFHYDNTSLEPHMERSWVRAVKRLAHGIRVWP